MDPYRSIVEKTQPTVQFDPGLTDSAQSLPERNRILSSLLGYERSFLFRWIAKIIMRCTTPACVEPAVDRTFDVCWQMKSSLIAFMTPLT